MPAGRTSGLAYTPAARFMRNRAAGFFWGRLPAWPARSNRHRPQFPGTMLGAGLLTLPIPNPRLSLGVAKPAGFHNGPYLNPFTVLMDTAVAKPVRFQKAPYGEKSGDVLRDTLLFATPSDW